MASRRSAPSVAESSAASGRPSAAGGTNRVSGVGLLFTGSPGVGRFGGPAGRGSNAAGRCRGSDAVAGVPQALGGERQAALDVLGELERVLAERVLEPGRLRDRGPGVLDRVEGGVQIADHSQ